MSLFPQFKDIKELLILDLLLIKFQRCSNYHLFCFSDFCHLSTPVGCWQRMEKFADLNAGRKKAGYLSSAQLLWELRVQGPMLKTFLVRGGIKNRKS